MQRQISNMEWTKRYVKESPENDIQLGCLVKGLKGENLESDEGSDIAGNIVSTAKTMVNSHGFEVENSDCPELAFTDRHWAEMAKLRDSGMFEDSDLRDAVDSKISDLVDEYDDLARYDEDLTILRDRVEDTGVTDDEYWAGYHEMARMLGIKKDMNSSSINGMTIRDFIEKHFKKKLNDAYEDIHWAEIEVNFFNTVDGVEDSTSFDIEDPMSSKGLDELCVLYEDFCKECRVASDTVRNLCLLHTADTYDELVKIC